MARHGCGGALRSRRNAAAIAARSGLSGPHRGLGRAFFAEIFLICSFFTCHFVLNYLIINGMRVRTGPIYERKGGAKETMPKAQGVKQAASNRKAFHDYFILERYEAGIELSGTEVKSIRAGTLNLKDSYCTIKNGEIFVRGMHISPYEKGNIFNRDPDRVRRLLTHRKEILKLNQRVMLEGVALVPLSVYFKDSRVKVEVGLCKGKKLYDKRDTDAKRQAQRDMDRSMKNY